MNISKKKILKTSVCQPSLLNNVLRKTKSIASTNFIGEMTSFICSCLRVLQMLKICCNVAEIIKIVVFFLRIHRASRPQLHHCPRFYSFEEKEILKVDFFRVVR